MAEQGINGFRYVSVIVDAATRYISLMPLTASNGITQITKDLVTSES